MCQSYGENEGIRSLSLSLSLSLSHTHIHTHTHTHTHRLIFFISPTSGFIHSWQLQLCCVCSPFSSSLPPLSPFHPVFFFFQSMGIIHSGANNNPLNQTQMHAVNSEVPSLGWACCQSVSGQCMIIVHLSSATGLLLLSVNVSQLALSPSPSPRSHITHKTDTPIRATTQLRRRLIQVFVMHRTSEIDCILL